MIVPIIIPIRREKPEPKKCPHCGKELPEDNCDFLPGFLVLMGLLIFLLLCVFSFFAFVDGLNGWYGCREEKKTVGYYLNVPKRAGCLIKDIWDTPVGENNGISDQ